MQCVVCISPLLLFSGINYIEFVQLAAVRYLFARIVHEISTKMALTAFHATCRGEKRHQRYLPVCRGSPNIDK